MDRLNEISLELPNSETVHGLMCVAAQLAFEVYNSVFISSYFTHELNVYYLFNLKYYLK